MAEDPKLPLVLRPIADEEALTVTELHGRVQALAEAMGL